MQTRTRRLAIGLWLGLVAVAARGFQGLDDARLVHIR